MITHYGLFWSERDVFWGRPRNPGQLLGRETKPLGRRGAPTKHEKERAHDYREFVGLYCLYNDGGLIYIGEAGLGSKKKNIYERLRDHKKGPMAGRWDSFSWFGRNSCEGMVDVKASLKQLEAISIAIINPGFNKQSGAFAGATQVYQVPHGEAEGDIDTKMSRISDQINSVSKMIKKLSNGS